MPIPIITLLTDFGLENHYIAVMKGVILSICPEARLVDITHQIPPFGIQAAAWELEQTWKYFPQGTIHLVVVDPGVGGRRLPLVGRADGHFFVGPDNGVIPGRDVRRISNQSMMREEVSHTFHGRDIFAPAAAHLARGARFEDVGDVLANPIRLPLSIPEQTGEKTWTGRIIRADRFGNLITNFAWDEFNWVEHTPLHLQGVSTVAIRYYPSYSAIPEGLPGLIRGSSGYLEIAYFESDAKHITGFCEGLEVILSYRISASSVPVPE